MSSSHADLEVMYSFCTLDGAGNSVTPAVFSKEIVVLPSLEEMDKDKEKINKLMITDQHSVDRFM